MPNYYCTIIDHALFAQFIYQKKIKEYCTYFERLESLKNMNEKKIKFIKTADFFNIRFSFKYFYFTDGFQKEKKNCRFFIIF